MTQEPHARHTYVRRRGRTTAAQQRALDESLNQFRLSPETLRARVCDAEFVGVEIGFGMGEALVQWAESSPEWLLLGIDVYLPGVGSLVNRLIENSIKNVVISTESAQEVLSQTPDTSIDEIRILFPDPWPKKRHYKRRLIQAAFVSDLVRVLKPGGLLVIATDWEQYAEWIREIVAGQGALVVELDQIRDGTVPSVRDTATKFEQRGERLGHRIHDLRYSRSKNSATTVSR